MKVVARTDRTHNPFDEACWVSRLRENLTSGSDGERLETGWRLTPVPRQSFTRQKYFDNFKNDLANAKAWGKSPVAIEQQALIGLMTYILTRLFLQRRYQELTLLNGDTTQERKHAQKIEQYLEQQAEEDQPQHHAEGWDPEDEPQEVTYYDAYRAFYAQLSKITRQVWRFLKNCFHQNHSLALYQRQLKPLLQRYL